MQASRLPLPAGLLGLALGLGLLPAACQSSAVTLPWSRGESSADAGTASCPARAAAPKPLPRVAPEHRTLAYWLARTSNPDEVVLDADAIRAQNLALAHHDRTHPSEDARAPFDLLAVVTAPLLEKEVRLRLEYLRTRIEKGELLDRAGKPPDLAPFAAPASLPPLRSELRLAQGLVPLACGPMAAGLYQGPVVEEAFDRNLCSTLRPGEPLVVLADWPGGMRLVRTRHALGFIAKDAPLSPPLREGEGEAAIARAAGTPRATTRRGLLTEAFALLDTPYGWGGRGGGRDCSQLVLEVLAKFGLEFPRHSGAQARAGSFAVELAEVPDDTSRLALLDAAHARGVVLLEMPGHIMLYLGRTTEGRRMVLHAFAEYREACDGGGETLRSVDRVEVSDLELGRGTAKKSFLERLRKLVVLGSTPGPALLGVADRRPVAPLDAAAPCAESDDTVVLVSPRHAHTAAPVRVVVASARDLGPASLELTGPGGERTTAMLDARGGPPFSYVAELPAMAAGAWRARLGDGPRPAVCKDFTVHEKPPLRLAATGSVWQPRARWTPAMESLYGAFVERLFAYPFDDRTWKDLQSLLADREHNLLFEHLGEGEERALRLEPDCADLPYFLRAYFAWKLGLPFAYRACNRGQKGKAPSCDRELDSNLEAAVEPGLAAAFQSFAATSIANGVHSGSGRTAPGDDHTDYYPVPLTREALAPGAVFADPYGHGYVVASWAPQRFGTEHGMLIGADAQPDGTISRRRFWRGTFLFHADTTEAGAGFKRFRPITFKGGVMRALANDAILRDQPGLAPHSLEQYEGGTDGFYDQVEALINPRPLGADEALNVLIDALYEQSKRRVVSVMNGLEFMAKHRGAIDMPAGHAVFETTGDWEDYSTPSRDMRLLVAIDTVMGFPDAVRRAPARFGIAEGAATAEIASLAARLDQRLSELAFEYERSDGTPQRLTVKDVVARSRGFEVAYNPNDCAELRWAAPAGTAELGTCKRRAPAGQRARMEQVRSWFATRTRPTR